MKVYSLLADLVLVLHFTFVLFVVGGLLIIWAGYFLKWRFVRNAYFRLAHLLAMGIVLAEAIGGVTCPLTALESKLRILAGQNPGYEGSFVQHWLHRLMFFASSEGTFQVVYAGFFMLILLSLWLVPPQRPNRVGTGRGVI